jgi:transketolase
MMSGAQPTGEPRASITAQLANSLAHDAVGPGTGLATALGVLIGRHARFDAADPDWPDRDRLLIDPAFEALCTSLARLLGAQPLETRTPATGIGVGLAMAERLMTARFGRSLVDHRVWVLCDGQDLATGAVQEAAWLAGAWRLGRLSVLAAVDDAAAPGLAGFAACGWAVRRADAGRLDEIGAALSAAMRSLKPTLLACVHTQPTPGTPAEHHDPAVVEAAWQLAGRRSAGVRRAWLKRLTRHAARADFDAAVAGRLPPRWHGPLSEPAKLMPAGQTAVSPAQTLREATHALAGAVPELVLMPGQAGWPVTVGLGDPGVARHAGRLGIGMAAMKTGMALHGGVLPVSAQPLARLDDLLAGLRAASLGDARLVHLLEESDEPCAVAGQRAALRAMPNLYVFRPADVTEALECLELAIRRAHGPSVVLASAEKLPALAERPSRTRSARGGYLAAGAAGSRAGTLLASGPELSVALAVRALLADDGWQVAVVSLPCWDMFGQQDATWRAQVLGTAPRVALEQGTGFGWDRWLGAGGLFIPLEAHAGHPEATRVAELTRRHLIASGAVQQIIARSGHATQLSTKA